MFLRASVDTASDRCWGTRGLACETRDETTLRIFGSASNSSCSMHMRISWLYSARGKYSSNTSSYICCDGGGILLLVVSINQARTQIWSMKVLVKDFLFSFIVKS